MWVLALLPWRQEITSSLSTLLSAANASSAKVVGSLIEEVPSPTYLRFLRGLQARPTCARRFALLRLGTTKHCLFYLRLILEVSYRVKA